MSDQDTVIGAAELARLGEELGLDVVGAAPAEPYDDTERHIAERKARGLFADMRFTMARPDVSCHPETLLPGARTVVSAAYCYYAPGPEPGPGEGRLPRYTWFDAYAELRTKLDELGRRLGGSYRVLVDANQHVDREGAVRAGIGFYGKNTMVITKRHGSWVVLGTVITDVAVEQTPRLDLDCGSCTLCIEACPTGALDEPGTLDANKCLSYWTQSAHPAPEPYRQHLGVYGCDICQDVCPWNRGIEKRRADNALPEGAQPNVSLVEWLEADPDELRRRYDRLFVPRNDGRVLQRNARSAFANEVAERIGAAVPEAVVELTGSASCDELEPRDIDLVALVDDVAAAAAALDFPPLYPEQWRDDWAAFRLDGPPVVDVVLTRPGTRGDDHHRRAWQLLRNDAALLAEYRTARHSAEAKRAFFERVVAELDRRAGA